MEKGKLYLIPTYLSSTNNGDNITNAVKNVIRKTSYYLVENVRTARRYIASLHLGLDIETIHFEPMDKRFNEQALPELFKPLLTGENMGILSEAGLPAIADPGNLVVRYAHQEDLEVVCLEGTSSIILGLISSGLNGQQFTFHGYLPIDPVLREKKIKAMEQTVLKQWLQSDLYGDPLSESTTVNRAMQGPQVRYCIGYRSRSDRSRTMYAVQKSKCLEKGRL